MPFSDEQKAKIKEILGEDVKFYDEDHVKQIIEQRDKVKQRLQERDEELEQLRSRRVLTDEEQREYEELKRKIKKTDVDDDELARIREQMREQHLKELDPIRQENERLKNERINFEKTEKIRSAALKLKFNDPNDAVNQLDRFVKVEFKDGSVVTTIVDAAGKKRYGKDAENMTIDELVEELASQKPYLIEGYRAGGSGALGGSGPFGGKLSDSELLAKLDADYEAAQKNRDKSKMTQIEYQRAQLRARINKR
jgi:hypothetical protein